MKRLVAVLSLIICLSFPAFAGHTVQGDSYCDCGTAGCIEDYPGECGGANYAASQPSEAPKDASAELGILIVALMLWLRLKA